MASLLCRKQAGGHVHIHDNDLIQTLMVDNDDNISTKMVSRGSARRRQPRPNTTPSPSRNMDSNSLIGKTMKVQDWLNERTVKTLQERSDLESKEARKLYSPLLQAEDTFVRDMESFVNTKDVMNLRKKEVLHKKWNERVYKPLRKKIIEAMDSNDWPEVDRRKREMHRQYLEFVNEKGHVFLDTMDPEEYYAMALNGHRPAPIKKGEVSKEMDTKIKKFIKKQVEKEKILRREIKKTEKLIKHTTQRCWRCAYKKQLATRRLPGPPGLLPIPICHSVDTSTPPKIETRPLLDPLISQGRERNEEERTILRCMTGYRYSDRDIEQVKLPIMPLVPLGRHGTDSIQWLKMPLSNIESTPRQASRKRMIGKFNMTQIDFDTWSKYQYNHQEVDQELQLQKKRQYPEELRPPYPKPVIRRPGLKPSPEKNVSFELVQPTKAETLAVEPINPSSEQVAIGVGNE